MHTLKTLFTTLIGALAAGSATIGTLAILLSPAPVRADTLHQCAPQLTATHTEFPVKSQSRGEYGVVRLTLSLSPDGRASDVKVTQSSGHKALDNAAIRSVSTQWRFDVAHCSAEELAKPRAAHLTFVRARTNTLASAIDPKAVAKLRKLAADTQCQQASDTVGTAIFSCIKNDAVKLTARAP